MDPRDVYDFTAEDYDFRHSSPVTQLIRRKELTLVKKFARGKILDFGCGTGFHLKPGIIGLDISEKMLQIAKKKTSLVIKSDERIPLKPGSLDTIYCFLGTFNLLDSNQAVKHFSSVLRPGGRVLLSLASIHENRGLPEKSLNIHRKKLTLKLYTKQQLLQLFSDFKLEHFDSLFIRFKPKWGNFAPLSIKDRLALLADKFLPKEKGRMYFLVFKK